MVLVWLYIVVLHRTNDGLWFYDAPRHAANGLFWWEFLASFPVNPVEFSLSYYARYPVISPPLIYPPVFYLLEGAAFWLFGNSPFVAKGLVLGFALSAGLYVTVWLQRWITEESGWGGALLVLQPGIIAWSNAIMLNIPSMALGVAALYHARRWLESPDSRHIYPTAFFTILALLTYYPAGIVVFVFLAWLLPGARG